jgi:hypothetical protein
MHVAAAHLRLWWPVDRWPRPVNDPHTQIVTGLEQLVMLTRNEVAQKIAAGVIGTK